MDIGLASVLSSIILGISGIIVSIIYGYIPRKRQTKIKSLQKELLTLYNDVNMLLKIQKELLDKSDVSKTEARRGFSISYHCEPARVSKRIKELNNQLK